MWWDRMGNRVQSRRNCYRNFFCVAANCVKTGRDGWDALCSLGRPYRQKKMMCCAYLGADQLLALCLHTARYGERQWSGGGALICFVYGGDVRNLASGGDRRSAPLLVASRPFVSTQALTDRMPRRPRVLIRHGPVVWCCRRPLRSLSFTAAPCRVAGADQRGGRDAEPEDDGGRHGSPRPRRPRHGGALPPGACCLRRRRRLRGGGGDVEDTLLEHLFSKRQRYARHFWCALVFPSCRSCCF